MGGSAFSSGSDPLYTPRMPANVYKITKERCHTKLRQLYACVASPIDGPGKTDFGDIDILVAWPHGATPNIHHAFDTIKETIGAARYIHEKGNNTSATFAISWPLDLPIDNSSDPDDAESLRYIQVDIRVCPSVDDLHWMLFKHGHGDLWNILGTIIRPYGLTVDDGAMWLRIPELEHKDRKLSKVFLSSEPGKILHFLGLPLDNHWERPFDSLEELFEYIVQCRMFNPGRWKNTNFDDYLQTLKSRERRRIRQRPVFREWMTGFLPRCVSEQRCFQQRTTRHQITKEAIELFHVGNEYHERRDRYLKEENREFVWTGIIKTAIPAPDPSDSVAVQTCSILRKAFKSIILDRDTSFGITLNSDISDNRGFFSPDKVSAFIGEWRNRVQHIAMERHFEGCRQNLEKKNSRQPSH